MINGEWQEAEESFDVKSPYSGEKIAEVYSARKDSLYKAIVTAEIARQKIKKLARFEVAKGLRNIASLIEKRKSEFVDTIIAESAKPYIYANGEVERAISTFNIAAAESERFCGDVVPVDAQITGRGKTAWTERIPRGVIYGITPFNFPLNLVAHKVAPALASKNAIVIKPSPRTPLTALLLGEVFLESGLPKGVLQIVPMDTKYIDRVLKDERISMISFTGSAEVGWGIKSKTGKKAVALELGGNAPVIIDASADMQKSVSGCVTGAFAYSGQVCISVQRILLHNKIADEWIEDFLAKTKVLKIGAPENETTQLSVMITEEAAARTQQIVDDAIGNGAKLLCGGKREGSMMDATVLTDTTPEMRVVSEEVFAPVVVIEKYSDFDEAILMANHSKYGLQAGVFTKDLANAHIAADELEYGGILINDVPTFRVDNMPYGGMKDSGFGREGVRYAMQEMTEEKIVVMSN